MSSGDRTARVEVLLITGGHAFDREPFLAAWQSDPGLHITHLEHPAATDVIVDGSATRYDCVVFYDMPGVDPLGPARPTLLPDGVQAGFERLTREGTGLVFLHHALASWPAWEGYAEIVGGRYHFWPAALRGQDWPDSGYLQETEHELRVAPGEHPVTKGVSSSFALTDELYLCAVLEDSITPILTSDFNYASENFYSTFRAMNGHRLDRQGWSHPPGSNIVGWVRQHERSRVVYLQPGDRAAAYGNAEIRTLWFNAVRWAAGRV
ncbi:ThuA domain-containing protein [Nocardia neocaledoniensis]|uniref:ThuA domain-containing protein n=1 Tax=Nocardia neocaledoniensis TaxID=236511 RepID=UPI0024552294|nr:ThuA domain-containing protein [Nocardia neocaledoniensis]